MHTSEIGGILDSPGPKNVKSSILNHPKVSVAVKMTPKHGNTVITTTVFRKVPSPHT